MFQFYPSSDDQIQLITSIAQKAGFGGGVVIDYPNSNKARKVFLCLFVGSGGQQQVPKGLDGEEVDDGTVRFERRRERERKRDRSGRRKPIKDRDWILKKKEVDLPSSDLLSLTLSHSSTASEVRRAFHETQSSPVDNENLFSNVRLINLALLPFDEQLWTHRNSVPCSVSYEQTL